MISPSQRPLPDKTQHSQQRVIHAPGGFKPTISAVERPQTYALDRAVTGTGYPHLGPLTFYARELPIIQWTPQWLLPAQHAQQRQETSIHALTGNGTRDPSQDVPADFTATRISQNRFYRTLLQAHFFCSLHWFATEGNTILRVDRGKELRSLTEALSAIFHVSLISVSVQHTRQGLQVSLHPQHSSHFSSHIVNYLRLNVLPIFAAWSTTTLRG